jgi:hypothetical protein
VVSPAWTRVYSGCTCGLVVVNVRVGLECVVQWKLHDMTALSTFSTIIIIIISSRMRIAMQILQARSVRLARLLGPRLSLLSAFLTLAPRGSSSSCINDGFGLIQFPRFRRSLGLETLEVSHPFGHSAAERTLRRFLPSSLLGQSLKLLDSVSYMHNL